MESYYWALSMVFEDGKFFILIPNATYILVVEEYLT